MTLGHKLVDKLSVIRQAENGERFSLTESGANSGYLIKERMDGIDLQIEIEDFDKFSYMVKTISLTCVQAPPSTTSLKELLLRQSAESERRISYLLESFHLVEVDEFNWLAQVRSVTPYRKNEDRLYYEVLLQHGNSVTFTRYRMQRQAEQREVIPSHLTQEIFERLVDDLAAVIQLG
jgi:hypothetical protein